MIDIIGYLQNLIYFIAGILGIGFVIGFHELGHFLFCKLFSIDTPTFSIGIFGPRLFSRKIGKTEFIVTAIPLGGYVEIAGNAEVGQGEQKEALRTDEYSFASKPYYQKLLVMIGGILFNMIFAYAAMIFVLYTGAPDSRLLYPYNATTKIKVIDPDSPAQKYNLKEGDIITHVNNIPATSFEHLISLIQPLADQEATITVERDSTSQNINLIIGSRISNCEKIGMLGFAPETITMPQLSLVDSIKKGISLTNNFVIKTFMDFKSLFHKKHPDKSALSNVKDMAGPLMIISMMIKSAAVGFKVFLLLLIIISVNLAVLNLLPLPIFDGGQIMFTTIEAIIGRSIPIRIKEYIFIACWILVLILFAYLTFNDSINICKMLPIFGNK